MTRISERETVFCLIYESTFFDLTSDELIANAQENREIKVTDYIRSTLNGASIHYEELDKMISEFAKGWKLDRIPKVTLAILRLASYEMLYNDDIPVSVAINEAVELAKKYDVNDAPSFVNGILGSIARSANNK